MADIPVKIYDARKVRPGAVPSIPSNSEDNPPPIVNPPGSGGNSAVNHNSTLNKQGGDVVLDEFYHVTLEEKNSIGNLLVVDGIINKGTITQSGNDLTLNTDWSWRISGVAYTLLSDTTLTFPDAATGYQRIDLIVGNSSGGIQRVVGTEVLVTDPLVAPTPPAGTIPLAEIFVLETGISSVEEMLLGMFVRYDVNDQGLAPVQRQNARENIEALSRDTDDTRSGILYQNSAIHAIGETSAAFSRSHHTFRNGIAGAGTTRFYGTNGGSMRQHFEFFGSSDQLHTQVGNGHVVSNQPTWRFYNPIRFNGALSDVRSSGYNRVIRRDEQRLYYLVSDNTAGVINDFALTDGIFNYRFTACTDLTGIAGGEIGRKIIIQNDNTVDMLFRHESTGSIAANRAYIIGATDLTIPTKGKIEIIYCTGNRWELVSKNF